MTRTSILQFLLGAFLAGTIPSPWARSQPDGHAPEGVETAPQPERDTALLRDPFWPIGWRPSSFGRNGAAGEVLTEQARWNEALGQLRVTGLTRGPDGSYLAIIKGAGIVEKGDVISVRYNALVYRWKIVEITSAGIVPEPLGISKE